MNGLFTLLPHLPLSLIYKRTWHPDPKKMVILRQSLPCSRSASSPIKVSSLPQHLSLGFIGLSCSKQSELELGIKIISYVNGWLSKGMPDTSPWSLLHQFTAPPAMDKSFSGGTYPLRSSLGRLSVVSKRKGVRSPPLCTFFFKYLFLFVYSTVPGLSCGNCGIEFPN